MKVKANKKFLVNVDIDSVWTVLTNPEKIVVCVPGAQLTETIDEDHFKGKVTIEIGPVTAKFNGDVKFNKRDSSTYELSMEGKGADICGKGVATMNMELTLNSRETFTEISCIMTVSITGRIAQFGSRMIEAVNNNLFEQFIKNFSNLLAQETERGNVDEVPSKAVTNKAALLVGSIIVSEFKRKFGKKAELE